MYTLPGRWLTWTLEVSWYTSETHQPCKKKRIILHVSCASRFVWEVDQYAGTCEHETATATQRWRVWMHVGVWISLIIPTNIYISIVTIVHTTCSKFRYIPGPPTKDCGCHEQREAQAAWLPYSFTHHTVSNGCSLSLRRVPKSYWKKAWWLVVL